MRPFAVDFNASHNDLNNFRVISIKHFVSEEGLWIVFLENKYIYYKLIIFLI